MKSLKPSSIWTPRHLLMLIVIVATMFVISLFMYSGFQQSLLATINVQNAQFVEQVNSTTAVLQNIIQSFATQIYHSASVTLLRTNTDFTNFEMIEAMREINKYDALCPFIDSIYLYNGKLGYIYSATSSSSFYSDQVHRFKDISAVELLLSLKLKDKLVPIYRYNGGFSSDSRSNYVYSYLLFDVEPSGNTGDNALMLNISSAWFNDLLFGQNNLSQWIIDENDDIIARPNWEIPLSDVHESALNLVCDHLHNGSNNGYFTTGHSFERQIYFYSRMGNTGWCYVRAVSYEDCMGALLKVQRIVWAIFALLIFLAAIVMIHIAVNLLFPYRKLVTELSQIEGVNSSENDTSKMLEQLSSLADRSRDMERLNASFKEMVREETVRNILFGSQSKPFDAELAEQYCMNLQPDKPLFLILVTSIRLNRYLEHVKQFTPYAEGAVISAEYTVLLIQADESLSPSICQSVSEGAPGRHILYTPICTDWNSIVSYYAMLREAYLRRFLYDDTILSCKSMLSELDDLGEPLDACIQDILQLLRKGSCSEACLKYMELVVKLREKHLQTVFVTLTHLFTDVTQSLFRLNPAIQPDISSRRKQFDKLLSAPESMESINTYFFALFDEFIETGNMRQKEKRGSLVSRIQDQIEKELSNPALNSQSLADHFSLSSAYLSRIFRQETGISLTDYINRKRIERAQELLKKQDLFIKDIALQTGFSTEKYFYVVFRKITGITPKQYREDPTSVKTQNILSTDNPDTF